jgi:hypothetical protein
MFIWTVNLVLPWIFFALWTASIAKKEKRLWPETVKIINSVSDDDFKDYVGSDAYKFIGMKHKITNGITNFSECKEWSWWAGLLPVPWLSYYKCWSRSLILMALLPQIVLMNAGALLHTAQAVSNIPNLVEDADVIFAIGACIALTAVIISARWAGRYAKMWYVSYVCRQIVAIKAIEQSQERIRTIFRETGGRSVALLVVAIGVLVGAWCVRVLVLEPPMTHDLLLSYFEMMTTQDPTALHMLMYRATTGNIN